MIRRAVTAAVGTPTGRRVIARGVASVAEAIGRTVGAIFRALRPDVNRPGRTIGAGVLVSCLAMLFTGSLHIGIAVIVAYAIVAKAQSVRLNARRIDDDESPAAADEITYAPLDAPEVRRLDIDSDLTAPAALPERRTR